MTTFFQFSGIVFWLCIIAGVVDIMYTKHFNWPEGLKVWSRKKHSKRYPPKKVKIEKLPDPLEQRNDDLDSDRINGVET